jgi:hypothetical protein
MIAYLVGKLEYLDLLIDLNEHNPEAVKSLLARYRQEAKILAELRDKPTDD